MLWIECGEFGGHPVIVQVLSLFHDKICLAELCAKPVKSERKKHRLHRRDSPVVQVLRHVAQCHASERGNGRFPAPARCIHPFVTPGKEEIGEDDSRDAWIDKSCHEQKIHEMIEDPRQSDHDRDDRTYERDHRAPSSALNVQQIGKGESHRVIVDQLARPGRQVKDDKTPNGKTEVEHDLHDIARSNADRHDCTDEKQRKTDPHDADRDQKIVPNDGSRITGVVGSDDPL